MIKKILYILLGIFLCIGIVILIIGFTVVRNLSPMEKENKTTAIITRIEESTGAYDDDNYDVFVKYEVDGKTYEEELNAYSTDYRVGKEIEVLYDSDKPEEVTVPWVKGLLLAIFGLVGGSFTLIGLVGLIILSRIGSKKKYLLEKGDLVYAKFVRVEENRQVYVNGRNPFQIVCEWVDPESGEKYTYRSEFIYEDPRDKLEGRAISQIPVYVDYKNKYKYYVDISQLLGE